MGTGEQDEGVTGGKGQRDRGTKGRGTRGHGDTGTWGLQFNSVPQYIYMFGV